MKFLKNPIFTFILGGIIFSGVGVFAAIKINASDVTYIDKNDNKIKVDQALNQLYEQIDNFTATSNLSSDLNEIVSLLNVQVDINDVVTTDFCTKISSSKVAAKKMIDSVEFRNKVSTSLLTALNLQLVSPPSNNSNVIYSSEYNASWAAYQSFLNGNGWCSAVNQTSNAYIGYNFNKNVNVRAAKFYNGGNDGYAVRDIKLQYSDDNSTWNDASDVLSVSNEKKDIFVFNSKDDNKHQYWRIFIVNSYTSYIELNKLQFYGIE